MRPTSGKRARAWPRTRFPNSQVANSGCPGRASPPRGRSFCFLFFCFLNRSFLFFASFLHPVGALVRGVPLHDTFSVVNFALATPLRGVGRFGIIFAQSIRSGIMTSEMRMVGAGHRHARRAKTRVLRTALSLGAVSNHELEPRASRVPRDVVAFGSWLKTADAVRYRPCG